MRTATSVLMTFILVSAVGCAKRAGGSDEIGTVTDAGRLPRTQAGAFVGQVCKVQFRRDALGMANPAPLTADADSTGGRAVQLTGVVHSIADGWVLIVADTGASYLIPQSSILLIQKIASPPAPAVKRKS